jgi:hypothetical protein
MRRYGVVWVYVEGIMIWFPAGANILPVSESGKAVGSTNGQEKDSGSNPDKDKWVFYSPKCWDWLSDCLKFLFKNPEGRSFQGLKLPEQETQSSSSSVEV